MAKTPTKRVGKVPIKYRPDREKWELTIHANGKRSRTLYATEEEAVKAWAAHLNRLKRFGTDAAVTPADLAELAEARRIIPGVDLRDAAKVANWSRHTNAGQLYKSYVARLVSRDEALRFTQILPK